MRFPIACTVLLSLCTVLPATSQSSAGAGPVDLSSFRDDIAQKNKALADEVSNEKAIVKRNAVIIQDAKKIDAANKRLEAQRRALDAQNAGFQKQREAMEASDTPAPAPMRTRAPVRAEAVAAAPIAVKPQPRPSEKADAPVQPVMTRPTASPARQDSPSTASSNSNSISAVTPAGAAKDSSAVEAAIRIATGEPGPLSANEVGGNAVAGATNAIPAAAPLPPAPVVAKTLNPLRVSAGVSQGMLLAPIRPVYPPMAVTARVEGAVVLEAVISKSGKIESLHTVSGPAMLRGAALDAVQTARYQPYRVNGEPVDVQTTITVVFRMGT